MTKFEVSVTRGEVTILKYDEELLAKISDFILHEGKLDKDSGYCVFRRSVSALVDSLEAIVGDESFSLVILVDGEKKKYGPGAQLY